MLKRIAFLLALVAGLLSLATAQEPPKKDEPKLAAAAPVAKAIITGKVVFSYVDDDFWCILLELKKNTTLLVLANPAKWDFIKFLKLQGDVITVEGQLSIRDTKPVDPVLKNEVLKNKYGDAVENLLSVEKGKKVVVLQVGIPFNDKEKSPPLGKAYVEGKAICGMRDLKRFKEKILAVENAPVPVVLQGKKASGEADRKGRIGVTGSLSVDKAGFVRLQADEVKDVKVK